MKRPVKPAKRVRAPEVSPSELIRTALSKRKKSELIEFLVDLSKEHLEVRRELENRLSVRKPVALTANEVEAAIALATDFDERLMNRNFDYDYASYEVVEAGLKLLIQRGELEAAKRLSTELMELGSYQVECSDEGLMTEEIENCLRPVIKAVKREGGHQAKQWAAEMIAADRLGFICNRELRKLAESKS